MVICLLIIDLYYMVFFIGVHVYIRKYTCMPTIHVYIFLYHHTHIHLYNIYIVIISQHCLSLMHGLLMMMGTGKDWPVPYLDPVPGNMVVAVIVNAVVLVLL